MSLASSDSTIKEPRIAAGRIDCGPRGFVPRTGADGPGVFSGRPKVPPENYELSNRPGPDETIAFQDRPGRRAPH